MPTCSGITLEESKNGKTKKMTMNPFHTIIILARTILFFTIVIAGSYVLLIPKFFPGYASPSVLIFGEIAATILGGYFVFRVDKTFPKIGGRLLFASFCGIIIATLVLVFSMLIILNFRGS